MTVEYLWVKSDFNFTKFDFIEAMKEFGAQINSYDVVIALKREYGLGKSYKVLKSHYFPYEREDGDVIQLEDTLLEIEKRWVKKSLVNFKDFYNIEVLFV